MIAAAGQLEIFGVLVPISVVVLAVLRGGPIVSRWLDDRNQRDKGG